MFFSIKALTLGINFGSGCPYQIEKCPPLATQMTICVVVGHKRRFVSPLAQGGDLDSPFAATIRSLWMPFGRRGLRVDVACVGMERDMPLG